MGGGAPPTLSNNYDIEKKALQEFIEFSNTNSLID
jgi:hypothetical protein